jgi:hypothetical protein
MSLLVCSEMIRPPFSALFLLKIDKIGYNVVKIL